MKIYQNSLRNRIFIAMILLTLISSLLIAGMSIYQSREQAKDYHSKRLQRKEQAIKEQIAYELRKTDFEVVTENLQFIFREEIYGISDIHGMPVNMYDLQGRLIKTSKPKLKADSLELQINHIILEGLKTSDTRRYVIEFEEDGKKYLSSYSYLTDNQFKNIAILNLPYLENDDFMNYELKEFLTRLSGIYVLMFLFSIGLAYFLSKYITKSISRISDRFKEINIAQRNDKIVIDESDAGELNALVMSYNNMVDQLEESAVKLATSEREQAWREMAKQVAHEIKNPLTPMRLTVQSFQRRFDPADPDSQEKLKEYSNSLIEQIDVMSNIASAFSTYATMPAQKSEETDVPMVTQLALDIFNESYITYEEDAASLFAIFDRTQLIRVVTNLIKNAIQALDTDRSPEIKVSVTHDEYNVYLKVKDNGTGVHEDHQTKIFEPKFTTKNSGMGLGLAMVKQIVENFKGTITMTTEVNVGTEFTVQIPRSR
ncbi:sensor histidine kinase [Nonlabens ulvanivorans]|uniref:histidine kinase n=1 Tax=Nonlabens ulvanivorans TaxID=906888 RepID=A0A084JTN7_NONUL|nr:HAMP domain-containing sensor histidine kinase [Nonlabens ulvanivorans]KEZ92321.1 histidine kinase [Nonlabens ulvanivorans]PRX15154.1 phospho-acceptor domain-containing protein [Nonlabens ulvanivorans]WOI22494.1 HAMP domain-containing sensor histidine kinase [Nonlabens ulvanivorans]GAK98801.1 nitrogen regulation protein NtrY [Nonlabens ulvanivorans]GAL74093.1 nitrogen regulation protein NtrY [Nonlabens ulvanivorans]